MISPRARIDPTSFVSREATIGDDCIIGPNIKIFGEVELGPRVWIVANSIIYGPAEIGEGSYIDSNVIIGYPLQKEIADIMQRKAKRRERHVTKIGKNVLIRSNCTVYSNVIIGNDVRFGHNVLVREGTMIGDETLVGTNVIIDGETKIGRRASIQTGAYISKYTIVEDFVFLGPNCILVNDKYLMQKKSELKGPIVKRGSSIGANAILFPAIVVGEGAVVGAGAVVTEDVPERTIVMGVPARVMKKVPKDWRSLLWK